ncbi:MAG TPA: hypothetical protein PLZ57_10875 [Pseudobdellovibrionaceae bacterium]|nr:hypothetical protein [Pseudobdellovibrionaceae bacterium]
MNLIYVRHAIAMEREEFSRYCIERGLDADDELRPLTAEGKRKMLDNARGLRRLLERVLDQHGSRPIIVTSPLVRARQTAEILERVFYPELHQADGAGKKKSRKKHKRLNRRKGPGTQILATETLAPGHSPEDFRNWLYDRVRGGELGRLPPGTVVLAIGHEPELSQAVHWWLTGQVKARTPFKKGGALNLELGQALFPSEARLMWSMPPSVLRVLSKAT